MKVYITSYNTAFQNASGGVQVRITNYLKHIKKLADVKKMDIWEDKIENCDILHVFKANIDSYSLIRLAHDKNKRIVLSSVIPQDKRFNIRYNLLLSRVLRIQTGYQLIKQELVFADVVIAQTEQEKVFISKYYGISPQKIEVVPNGISIDYNEECRYALQSKYDISKKFLLQVGRFDENKNQLSVIRALKGSGVPVLFIGGPDPMCQDYYNKCLSEADDNFTFLGWVDNGSPEIQSAYMNAHAVILPSKKEIFGNSLIEAGAAGARLVATQSLPLKSIRLLLKDKSRK